MKLVLPLEHEVALKIGMRDEQGILEVYLVLLVVVIVYKFTVARNGKLAGFAVGVCDLSRPYLVGLTLRNVVRYLGLDLLVLRGDDGIRGAMAAFALVLVEGLADGRPRAAPVFAALVVLDVDVTSRLIVGNAVEAVTDNTPVGTALLEAVTASVI